MPTISDNAICIRRWDFSETSQTTLLFCHEIGMLRGLAKGAKRPKSNFSGGFDVLTRGQVVAIVKPSSDLATITEWHIEQVYDHCRRDLHTNHVCLYMIDLLQHALTEHDPHEGAFVLLTDLLDAIESDELADRALLRWQLGLLEECGYRPELSRDAQTGGPIRFGNSNADALAFSSKHGGIVADTGESDRWRVRPETIKLLQTAQTGDLPIEHDAALLRRANSLLAAHWRELLGRQLATMPMLFPDLPISPRRTRRDSSTKQ